MIQTFKNAWKVPELRNKIIFTLIVILLYRIGANLYLPFVNVASIDSYAQFYGQGSVFEFLNILSGDAFSQVTLFALSVSPYITASIVVQLLTVAIPALEKLSKQGEEGRKKIASITRWITVVLALITAFGYVKLVENYGILTISKEDGAMYYFGYVVMIACLCAGAALILWLAERINDHGIGNGISIILFANIISRGDDLLMDLVHMMQKGVTVNNSTIFTDWLTGWDLVGGILKAVLSLALTVAAIVLIVWFTNSERRIPIQYAKRVVGRKMYGGQASNLPLKMNMAGVMPVIFASSIVSIAPTIAGFTQASHPNWFITKLGIEWLGANTPLYILLDLVLIFAFSYFYIMISFNPVEVANNIRSNGGSIPGIRPGKPTSDYIKKVLNRITLMGAVFLAVIDGVPKIVGAILAGFGESFSSIAFGGTSLLIVVGVALETVRELEAQLSMRNYKGFLD